MISYSNNIVVANGYTNEEAFTYIFPTSNIPFGKELWKKKQWVFFATL